MLPNDARSRVGSVQSQVGVRCWVVPRSLGFQNRNSILLYSGRVPTPLLDVAAGTGSASILRFREVAVKPEPRKTQEPAARRSMKTLTIGFALLVGALIGLLAGFTRH